MLSIQTTTPSKLVEKLLALSNWNKQKKHQNKTKHRETCKKYIGVQVVTDELQVFSSSGSDFYVHAWRHA